MDAELFLQQFGALAQGEGGIKKLRDLILQLAVRGMLVEQNPADEPASAILQNIRSDHKAKKKSTIPIAYAAEQFPLPSKWAWTCLGEIAAYGVPQKINGNAEILPDTWVLDLEDIEKDTSRLLQRIKASERAFQSTKTAFQKDDVLFGKLRPYLNKVLVAPEAGICTTEIVPIRSREAISPHYIRLVLQSPMTMRTIERLMYGMKMPRLGTGDANNLPFPLPPLAEQRRIVAKVGELMALCDTLEAEQEAQRTLKTLGVQSTLHHLCEAETPASFGTSLNILERTFGNWFDDLATVKRLRSTIVQLAVQGKLVPQDPNDEPASVLLKRIEAEKKRLMKEGVIKREREYAPIDPSSIPLELPDAWEWVRFGNLFKLSEYGTSEKATEFGDIPVYSMGHIQDGVLVEKQFKFLRRNSESLPKLFLKHHDILFNRTNSYDLVGKAAAYEGESNTHTFASYLIRVELLHEFIDCFYANKYLNSPLCRVTQIEPEITNQTNQANFNGTKLQNILFPLPPLAEQKRIVAKVDELMTLCDRLEAHITYIQTLNTYLTDSIIHIMLEVA